MMTTHTNTSQNIPRRTRPTSHIIRHIQFLQIRHNRQTFNNNNSRTSQIRRNLIRQHTISHMSTNTIIFRRRPLRPHIHITRIQRSTIPRTIRSSITNNTMNIEMRIPIITFISIQHTIMIQMFKIRTNLQITNNSRMLTTHLNNLHPRQAINLINTLNRRLMRIQRVMKQINPFNFQSRLSRVILQIPRQVTFAILTLIRTNIRSQTSITKMLMRTFAITPSHKNRGRIRHRMFLTIQNQAINIQCTTKIRKPSRMTLIRTLNRRRMLRSPAPRLIRRILTTMLRNSRRHMTRTLNTRIIITNIRRMPRTFIILPMSLIQTFRRLVPITLRTNLSNLTTMTTLFRRTNLRVARNSHARYFVLSRRKHGSSPTVP